MTLMVEVLGAPRSRRYFRDDQEEAARTYGQAESDRLGRAPWTIRRITSELVEEHR